MEQPRTGLAAGSVGLTEVVFQSVAAMGPAATLVSSLPLVMAFAGGAAVSACLLALIGLSFVAFSVSQLAKQIPSAGSFATYASRSIHPGVGFVVGWLYLLLTLTVSPLLLLILASIMAAVTGAPSLWWLWLVGTLIAVTYVSVRGVRASSKLNLLLGAVEVLVFAFLSIALVIKAGSSNTVSVIGLEFANVSGHEGLQGVIAGAAYCILAFSGFESAASLAEETRDPRRAIPRAVLGSLFFIAAIEIFGVYAVTVANGPENAYEFSQIGGAMGQGWQDLATTVMPLGAFLVVFAVLNSCIANANAGVTNSTRTLFALGRARVLPELLAVVDARWRSPYVAIILQTVATLLVALPLGFAFGPSTAFGIVGTEITLAYVLLYLAIHISCYFFYRKRQDRSVLMHVFIPVAGFLLLLPELFVASGIQIFSFIQPVEAPFSFGALAVLVWIPIGVIYYAYIFKRRPHLATAMVAGIEEGP